MKTQNISKCEFNAFELFGRKEILIFTFNLLTWKSSKFFLLTRWKEHFTFNLLTPKMMNFTKIWDPVFDSQKTLIYLSRPYYSYPYHPCCSRTNSHPSFNTRNTITLRLFSTIDTHHPTRPPSCTESFQSWWYHRSVPCIIPCIIWPKKHSCIGIPPP